MISNKHIKNLSVSIIYLLFLASCSKKGPNANPFDDYISQKGASVTYKSNIITIPENALSNNQFIAINTTVPQNYALTIDTTIFYNIVSEEIGFVRYNCTDLKLSGTMILKRLSTNFSFNSSKAIPYCIDANDDINDHSNWEAITNFTRKSSTITFNFTDLEKRYFIGWNGQ